MSAVLVLVAIRFAHPVLPQDDDAVLIERCRRLNRSLANQALYSNHIKYLASPIARSGVSTNRFQLLFLSALATGGNSPDSLARAAWSVAERSAGPIQIEGQLISNSEEGFQEFLRRAQVFVTDELPELSRLGVV